MLYVQCVCMSLWFDLEKGWLPHFCRFISNHKTVFCTTCFMTTSSSWWLATIPWTHTYPLYFLSLTLWSLQHFFLPLAPPMLEHCSLLYASIINSSDCWRTLRTWIASVLACKQCDQYPYFGAMWCNLLHCCSSLFSSLRSTALQKFTFQILRATEDVNNRLDISTIYSGQSPTVTYFTRLHFCNTGFNIIYCFKISSKKLCFSRKN